MMVAVWPGALLQPMLDSLCSKGLTCKGSPGSMPRGEEVEQMKQLARPALRGIHVGGTSPVMLTQTTPRIFAPTVLRSRVKS